MMGVRQPSFKTSRSKLFHLSVLLLLQAVSTTLANYEFMIRFHEFRNPLGLQCATCGTGGSPACCDDATRQQNCLNTPPQTCDTRFRFTLRPYRAPLTTAPTGRFPHYTPSNGGNSETFREGSGGFLGLPNPFTINETSAWPGRIQFFIDALDKVVSNSGLVETEELINRFPVNLQLQPGQNFTNRANYTGIYSVSGQQFDISFRVQCSGGFYGPNCTTICTPTQNLYTCDKQGRPNCTQNNRDPATNCTTCLSGYNPLLNCLQCLQGRDMATNCTSCLPGYDSSTSCLRCLPGHVLTDTTTCKSLSGGNKMAAVLGWKVYVSVAFLVASMLVYT